MRWQIDLSDLKWGQYKVETSEGSIRHGKITKIHWREKVINGRPVTEPTLIEMNDDPVDSISWDIIIKIERTDRSLTGSPKAA